MRKMNMGRYLMSLLLIVALHSCTKEDTVPNTNNGGGSTTVTASEQKLLDLVNKARAEGCNCGSEYFPPVAPVTWNDKLETAARNHSIYMQQNNVFSHTGAGGSDPGDRITEAGYNWSTYGENIAYGYTSEESVIKGWLESEGHCKNIMNGNFTEMGVGVSGTYWTQDFGRPR